MHLHRIHRKKCFTCLIVDFSESVMGVFNVVRWLLMCSGWLLGSSYTVCF